MIKVEPNRLVVSDNIDTGGLALCSNFTQQRYLLRAQRQKLSSIRKSQNEEDFNSVVYGDPTPYDKHGVAPLIKNWQYGTHLYKDSRDLSKVKLSLWDKDNIQNEIKSSFNFKIGNKKITERLDNLDQNYQSRRSTTFCPRILEEETYVQSRLHGKKNPTPPHTIDEIVSQRPNENEYYLQKSKTLNKLKTLGNCNDPTPNSYLTSTFYFIF